MHLGMKFKKHAHSSEMDDEQMCEVIGEGCARWLPNISPVNPQCLEFPSRFLESQ